MKRPITIAAAMLLLATPLFAQDDPGVLARMLSTAIAGNDVEAIESIRNIGARIPDQGENGEMLLGIAAVNGTAEMIEALHAMGANIEWRDYRGYTPLMLALEAAQIDNANTLKELGADLSAVSNDGYSAAVLAEIVGATGFESGTSKAAGFRMTKQEATQILLLASELGSRDNVELALGQGGDAYAKAANGWTPVMLAALGGHAEIVELLARAMPDRTAGIDVSGDNNEPFDVVQAALAGEGQGDREKVSATLDVLRIDIFGGRFKGERVSNYRATAKNIGYDAAFIDRYFSGVDEPEFLPPLEYALPVGSPPDKEGWMEVQRILKEEGLYSASIDGIPGEATMSALLAYILPLEQILIDRAEQAARRAEQASFQTVTSNQPRYGKLPVRGFFGEVWNEQIGGYGRHGEFGTYDIFKREGVLNFFYSYNLNRRRSEPELLVKVTQRGVSTDSPFAYNVFDRNLLAPIFDLTMRVRTEYNRVFLDVGMYGYKITADGEGQWYDDRIAGTVDFGEYMAISPKVE